MDDLISRKALLEELERVSRYNDGRYTWVMLSGVENIINVAKAESPGETPIAVVQFNEKQLRDICNKAAQNIVDEIQHGDIVLKEEKPTYEYTVVRSFASGCKEKCHELYQDLKNGWEVVRASEVVKNDHGYSDYIEYILRREKGGDVK